MITKTVSMPLFVMIPRKTMDDVKYIINLNGYRNWAYHLNHQIKMLYLEEAESRLKGLEFGMRVKLSFTLWKGQNRRIDRANPLSIHEKFFCDAMTHYKCFPDDNDDYIHSTHYYTGGVDRENPRVEIEMKEVED